MVPGSAMKAPTADFIFGKINRRHHENQNIMQVHKDGCGQFVAAQRPCDRNRQQGLERIKRRESKKDPNR